MMTEPELVHIAKVNNNATPSTLSTSSGGNNTSAVDPGAAVMELETGGWEWTSTPFYPFEGFQPDPLYPEYSTDFFDDCHFVLRGSCPYTHPSVRRLSFRNYYQKQYPHMFAKFRIVKDVLIE